MAYSSEDVFQNYRKTFVVAPFKPKQVTPLGYDLRLGYAVVIDSTGAVVSPTEPSNVKSAREEISIPPGGAAFVATLERVFLSGKVLGTVHARARLSFRGIQLNAVTVDPNFGHPGPDGLTEDWFGSRLLLRLQNISSTPVTFLQSEDSIATLILHEVQTETSRKPRNFSMMSLIGSLQKEGVNPMALGLLRSYISIHSKNADGTGDSKAEDELKVAIAELMGYRAHLRSKA